MCYRVIFNRSQASYCWKAISGKYLQGLLRNSVWKEEIHFWRSEGNGKKYYVLDEYLGQRMDNTNETISNNFQSPRASSTYTPTDEKEKKPVIEPIPQLITTVFPPINNNSNTQPYIHHLSNPTWIARHSICYYPLIFARLSILSGVPQGQIKEGDHVMVCVNRNVLPPVINIRDDYVIIPRRSEILNERKLEEMAGSCLRAFVRESLQKLVLIKI